MFGIFPEDDYRQTLRLKRFLMAFASYLMWSIIALFAFLMGIIPGQYSILIGYLAAILLCNIFIYSLIRTGFNKRFKDPSLTLLQMVIATFWIMVFAYYAGPVRSVVLLVYLITFVFGLFKLNVRQYFFLSAFAVVNYAVVILLLHINHPESVNGKVDVLNLIVLAVVLPWFSMVGGYITRLRDKVNKSISTIKESEFRFRTIFDSASDGIVVLDIREGKFSDANEKICNMLGYTREEFLKLSIPDIHPQESIAFVIDQHEKLVKKEILVASDIPVLRKDKSVFYADISASTITLVGKEYSIGLFRDISEHKLAKESLQQSEEKYRSILENMREGYFESDFKGYFTFFNDIACQDFGYSREELLRLHMSQYTDEETTKELIHSLTNLYKTGEPIRDLRWQIIRKDGLRRDVEGSMFLLKDSSGKRIGFQGIVRDITERKRAEVLLKQSEEKYRLLADHMKDQVWVMDLELNMTYISPSVERALGYSLEELKEIPLNKLLTLASFQAARDFFSIEMPKALAAPSDYILNRLLELEFRCKDGHTVWGECMFSFIRDDQGKPLSVLGEARDITERKKIEKELFKSEGKYRTILEEIQEGYFEVDLAGNFISFNDTVVRDLGYSRDELMGMNNRQYTNEEELKKIYQAYNKVYLTGEPNKELVWKIRRKDGATRYIEGAISLLKGSSGKPIGFRGIAHDITERIQIEKKLQEEEQRFRTLAEQSLDIIIMANKKGFITYENPAVYILGINPEARIGTNVFERVHPDDLKHVTDSFHILFSDINAPVQKAELRLRHTDGRWLTFEAMGSNLVRDNIIEAAIVNLRDITERKQAEEKLQKTLDSLKKAVGTTIQVLVTALESRDPYTAGHQSRSANLASAIATEMGLSEDRIEGIRMAGIIHDIGKLAIPAEILTKPSKLTKLEFSLIKEHSQCGFEMLKDVESPWPLAEIVHQHHERINGTGYPQNLRGDEILLEARILAVSDVVESMASHRPYRPALGIKAALEEIENNKGILYDTTVADACLRLFREKGYRLP